MVSTCHQFDKETVEIGLSRIVANTSHILYEIKQLSAIAKNDSNIFHKCPLIGSRRPLKCYQGYRVHTICS